MDSERSGTAVGRVQSSPIIGICRRDDDDDEDSGNEDSYAQKLQRAKTRIRAENRTLKVENLELRALLEDARLLKKCRTMCRAARKAGISPSILGFSSADLINETIGVRKEVVATMPDPVRTEPGGELQFLDTDRASCANHTIYKVQDIVEPASAVRDRMTPPESPSDRKIDAYAQTLVRVQTRTNIENVRLQKDNDELRALVEKLRLLEECRSMCRAAEKAGKDPADLGFDYEALLKEKEAVRRLFEASTSKRKTPKRSPTKLESLSRATTASASSTAASTSRTSSWMQLPPCNVTQGDPEKSDAYRQAMQDVRAKTWSECAKLHLQNDELRNQLERARVLEETRSKSRAAMRAGSSANLGIDMEEVSKQREAVRRRVASMVSRNDIRPPSRSSSLPSSRPTSGSDTSRQEAPRTCSWSLTGSGGGALEVGRVGLPPLRC